MLPTWSEPYHPFSYFISSSFHDLVVLMEKPGHSVESLFLSWRFTQPLLSCENAEILSLGNTVMFVHEVEKHYFVLGQSDCRNKNGRIKEEQMKGTLKCYFHIY